MAKFCVNYEQPLGEHVAFCGGCGKAVTGPAPFSAPPGQGSGSGMSPPPPVGNAFGGGPSNSTGTAGGLQPSPPLWDFQQKLIPIGESLTSGLGPNPTGVLNVLSRIIRATFLDPRIARQAALDENGTGEAILAIVLTTLPGIVLGWLGASSFGFGILSAMISTVLMSLVSLGHHGRVNERIVIVVVGREADAWTTSASDCLLSGCQHAVICAEHREYAVSVDDCDRCCGCARDQRRGNAKGGDFHDCGRCGSGVGVDFHWTGRLQCVVDFLGSQVMTFEETGQHYEMAQKGKSLRRYWPVTLVFIVGLFFVAFGSHDPHQIPAVRPEG